MSTSSVDETVHFQQTKINLKCLPANSDTPFPETYKLFLRRQVKRDESQGFSGKSRESLTPFGQILYF